MSIKEAKKILKHWRPVITVPASLMESSTSRNKLYFSIKEYAEKLKPFTLFPVLVVTSKTVDEIQINWPLKQYSQRILFKAN